MRFLFFFLILSFVIPVQNNDRILVDNFESGDLDDWKGRRKKYEEIYRIDYEDGNAFLTASSRNSDNLIVKRIYVDLNEYPYLNWKWRAHAFPENGNESVKAYCDSPASIAVVLNRSRVFPKSIKYAWSSSLPESMVTKSPYARWPARCDVIVTESGKENAGEWVHEKVNVKEDLERFYKKSELRRKDVFAIVIMTDSDNIGQLSKADYDNIYFSRS